MCELYSFSIYSSGTRAPQTKSETACAARLTSSNRLALVVYLMLLIIFAVAASHAAGAQAGAWLRLIRFTAHNSRTYHSDR